jgi:heme/copper-type cytochrome/quinol oxidase subunit 2
MSIVVVVVVVVVVVYLFFFMVSFKERPKRANIKCIKEQGRKTRPQRGEAEPLWTRHTAK